MEDLLSWWWSLLRLLTFLRRYHILLQVTSSLEHTHTTSCKYFSSLLLLLLLQLWILLLTYCLLQSLLLPCLWIVLVDIRRWSLNILLVEIVILFVLAEVICSGSYIFRIRVCIRIKISIFGVRGSTWSMVPFRARRDRCGVIIIVFSLNGCICFMHFRDECKYWLIVNWTTNYELLKLFPLLIYFFFVLKSTLAHLHESIKQTEQHVFAFRMASLVVCAHEIYLLFHKESLFNPNLSVLVSSGTEPSIFFYVIFFILFEYFLQTNK